MKRYIILILNIMFIAIPAIAQSNYDSVLSQIEANSVTLQAFKQQVEAQQLGNRTGIYLQNPEIGFGYLWGSPASTGNRTDFSVTQSFDFPTAYSHRSQVSEGRNMIAEYEYDRLRKELLLQAGNVCVNLIYSNKLQIELDKRLQHAQSIASAYQGRFAQGDIDILERNKAQLNLLNAQKASEVNVIERSALQAELVRLNGGKPLSFDDMIYPIYAIPQDFEQWYSQTQQNNPTLQIIAQEIEVSRNQEKLNRAMSLPKLSAGYMSESILGTMLQGVTVGVSIPLWENKNTIKQSKAQTTAWQNMEADAQVQFYNLLKTQHAKALSLQTMVNEYQKALGTTNNLDLLKKALDQGSLSLINYMLELSIYYDAMDKLLQAERDSWLASIELMQWEK